jgi:hypothetical protein
MKAAISGDWRMAERKCDITAAVCQPEENLCGYSVKTGIWQIWRENVEAAAACGVKMILVTSTASAVALADNTVMLSCMAAKRQIIDKAKKSKKAAEKAAHQPGSAQQYSRWPLQAAESLQHLCGMQTAMAAS